MKKYFIFLLLTYSLTIIGQDKANLSFSKKTIDLGSISHKKKPIIVNYIFTNEGQKPLVIYKVKASCGCTIPTWPKAPIKPGEKSLIKVEFYTESQKGVFMKTLFVESNSKEDVMLIKLKGRVK